MTPDKEWAVIEVGESEGIEKALNRATWHLYGYEVFALLSNPDRVVFRKKPKAEA